MSSQVCWPVLNSLPHPTAVPRSHRPATLLTLVSNWHCGVNLQRHGHVWLQKTNMESLPLKYKAVTYCIYILPVLPLCVDHLHTCVAISVFVLIQFAPPAKSRETISVSSLTLFTIKDFVAAVIYTYGSEVWHQWRQYSFKDTDNFNVSCSIMAVLIYIKKTLCQGHSILKNAEALHCTAPVLLCLLFSVWNQGV